MGCTFSIPGFGPKTSTFQIVDRGDANNVRRYQETFDEAYYDLDGHGNVNIVLRGKPSSDAGEADPNITQVICIKSVWQPLPGRTVSDPTQINAVVSYFVFGGRVGDSLEGAGAVHFTQEGDTLTATLDQAVLRPKRQLTPGKPLFTHAELSGEFQATRDPRRVVQIINEMERRFGPLPPANSK